MPDGFARLRRGEKRPLYGLATAQTGTLTIGGAPTCTLYDAVGTAVAGHEEQPVTGHDTGAQAAPRVWLNLDTRSPAELAAGYYTLVFTFTATGSDGVARVFRPAIEVQVEEVSA